MGRTKHIIRNLTILLIGCTLFLLTSCVGFTVPTPTLTSSSPTAINLPNTPLPTLTQTITTTPTKIYPTLTPENTNAALYPAGNGDLIAFNSEITEILDENVYNLKDSFISVANINNRSVVRLTSESDIAGRVTWSPDGKFIAYSIGESLHIIYPNGTHLSSMGFSCSTPILSPDGTAMACISSGSLYLWSEISFTDLKNRKMKQVTKERELWGTGSWSPDSKKYAYSKGESRCCCCGAQPKEIKNIFVQDTQGDKDPVQLTNAQSYDTDPQWSPDGKHILFTSLRTGIRQVYIMNADGTNEYALTTDDKPNFGAKWSPDGTKIVFVSMRHERDTSKCPHVEAPCNTEIYVMNPDGSKQTRITNHPSTDNEPIWSSDGTKIAFVSLRDEPNKKCEFICNSEIYIIGVDGKNTTRLTNNQIRDFGPAWQPKP